MQQRNQVGGNGNGPNGERSTQVIAQELALLKTALKNQIRLLPNDGGQPPAPNSRQAVKAKFDQALKDQHKISHGNLIEQMKKQQENTQKDLVAQANIQNENQKRNFNDAISHYFTKRLELARAKLQEVNSAEKLTKKAQKQITSEFRTPEGKTGADVLQKLGDTHNHIVPANGKEADVVKLENGKLTSRSPTHLANTAKSLGWKSFKFNTAKATRGGANNLIGSIEAMLRVGIKQVEIDPELMKKMLATPHSSWHSSADYAAQLASAIKDGLRVSDGQKSKLRQLQRICAASTSAYKDVKSNPVFDADGKLKANNEPTKLGHQAETFMRLTNKADRVTYLKLLYPNNTQRYYAAFTKELERRGKTFAVGNKTLSPAEYFKQEMLWQVKGLSILTRSGYQTQLDLVNKVEEFKAAATTDARRKEIYAETKDEKSLRQMLKTEHLDSNEKRKSFARAVFEKANTRRPGGNHELGLYTHPVTLLRYVTAEDKKHFMNRVQPLFSKIVVMDQANNNQVDFAATLREKSELLAELRTQSQNTYRAEKDIDDEDKPTAFNNSYKNKILLDELEDKMLQDHSLEKTKADIQNGGRQLTEAEQQALFQQNHAATIQQHLQTYNNLATPKEKAEHFAKQMSSTLQQQVWASMDNSQQAHNATIELRAQILKQFMDLHNEANSPAAMDYLKNSAKSLLARLDDADKTAVMAKLAELCLNDPHRPIVGCNRRENRALHALRDLVPTPAAQPLLSTELFKQYYQQPDNDPFNINNNLQPADVLAEKLLKRIQCYAANKPAHFVEAFRLNQKFEKEMKDLLYPNNTPNAHSEDILNELRNLIGNLPPAQQTALNPFVARINANKLEAEEAIPLNTL